MAETSRISWTHGTQNFWLGCEKIAPECAHCYIDRILRRQGREPWGQLYRAKSTWMQPFKWERDCMKAGVCRRIFTNSLSDFFHVDADAWRPQAWEIIRGTPHLVYLILTKRPALIMKRLPADWGEGYPNVWLGVSTGCRQTLSLMDELRKVPVHPKAVRFISGEPLLEDISAEIDLTGFGWVIVGGESGQGKEYLWDDQWRKNWRQELKLTEGRRIMNLEWARSLQKLCDASRIPLWFKQVTAFSSGTGEDALGRIYQAAPPPPFARWDDELSIHSPEAKRR
jgi:protein gp37